MKKEMIINKNKIKYLTIKYAQDHKMENRNIYAGISLIVNTILVFN